MVCAVVTYDDAIAVQYCGSAWYSTDEQMYAINCASKTNFQWTIWQYFVIWSLCKKPVSIWIELEKCKECTSFYKQMVMQKSLECSWAVRLGLCV